MFSVEMDVFRYPGGLAWQMHLSRKELRSSPELQRLKEFLFEQTEHVSVMDKSSIVSLID